MDEFDFRQLVGPTVVVNKATISDRQIKRVVAEIEEKYGFVPTDLYVRDLLAFVAEMMVNESQTEIVTRLTGDATLMAILTGGVYAYTEIRRLGLSRVATPTAFDADGFLRPCCVVKSRGPVPDPGIYDLKEKMVGRRQHMELWIYEETDYTAIDAAAERIYTLLQGWPLPKAWPTSWAYMTGPLTDDSAVKGASMRRADYLIVDLAKATA